MVQIIMFYKTVRNIAVKPTVSISGDETVKPLGQAISLLCQAAGNPEPSLAWIKDGQPLVSSPTGARITPDGGRSLS